METGLCECGCGEPAPISPYTSAGKGYVKGTPRRFITGHNTRGKRRGGPKLGKHYIIQDMGYETPCWIWIRSFGQRGYGHAWDPTRQQLRGAHLVVLEQHGRVIPEGLQADHLCRVRKCVNPDHLEAVTQSTNQRRGLNAKLTDADHVRLHQLRSDGLTLKQIGQELGVSEQTVFHHLRFSSKQSGT